MRKSFFCSVDQECTGHQCRPGLSWAVAACCAPSNARASPGPLPSASSERRECRGRGATHRRRASPAAGAGWARWGNQARPHARAAPPSPPRSAPSRLRSVRSTFPKRHAAWPAWMVVMPRACCFQARRAPGVEVQVARHPPQSSSTVQCGWHTTAPCGRPATVSSHSNSTVCAPLAPASAISPHARR